MQPINLGDSAFTTDVLTATVEESATLIVTEIETKQNAGTLDLSDMNDSTVAAILATKQAQEIVTQTGLDADAVTAIAQVAQEAAEINTLVATLVATDGIAVLTTSTTATAISDIVDDTLSLSSQLVTGEITLDEFNTLADVTAAPA